MPVAADVTTLVTTPSILTCERVGGPKYFIATVEREELASKYVECTPSFFLFAITTFTSN